MVVRDRKGADIHQQNIDRRLSEVKENLRGARQIVRRADRALSKSKKVLQNAIRGRSERVARS